MCWSSEEDFVVHVLCCLLNVKEGAADALE